MRPSTVLSLARRAAGSWRTVLAHAPEQADARHVRLMEIYEGFRPAFASVHGVEAVALRDRLASDDAPVLLDVRAAHEREISTLAGSVPAEQFLANPQAFQGRAVIAFCTLGVRSGAWAAERVAEGHAVQNLVGGLLGWAHAGGALVTADGVPTRRVHVSASRWNLVPEGYEGVW